MVSSFSGWLRKMPVLSSPGQAWWGGGGGIYSGASVTFVSWMLDRLLDDMDL